MTEGLTQLLSGPHIAVSKKEFGAHKSARPPWMSDVAQALSVKGLLGCHWQKCPLLAAFFCLFDLTFNFFQLLVTEKVFISRAPGWIVVRIPALTRLL